MFLEILQISLENTCARVSFLIKLQASGPQPCNFIKTETLAQVFSGEFCEVSKKTFFTEHLWATVSMLFKNLPFCVGYWHVPEYDLGGQTQITLAKWTAKLGVLVKIHIFSWDNMVFLWGICLLPEKMTLFFSILNKYLPIVARYLEVLCRIIEYPAKSTRCEFIYGLRTAECLVERIPSVLISGKIIWEKRSLLWE